MKRGLIVKGRRYYSPKFDEYLTAVKRGNRMSVFRRDNGMEVRLAPKNVFYLSVDDYNLCDGLATVAKMTWFSPWFDNATGTEVDWEEADKHTVSSYRTAIKDLSEGLIDLDFFDMPDSMEACSRFRSVVYGMGLRDPGDYLSMFGMKNSCVIQKGE